MPSPGPRAGGPRPSRYAARRPAWPVPVTGSAVMHPAADDGGLRLPSRAGRGGCVIAALGGELGIASAPALREQLLSLLRGASHLIIDLSAVEHADASGLAVLVGTGRRAGLLGGSLRLAAPAPEVTRLLAATGLNQHLDIYPTVRAAITGQPRLPDAILPPATVPARGHRGNPPRSQATPTVQRLPTWRSEDAHRWQVADHGGRAMGLATP
jgi:anti-anti-sigma factor